VLILVGMICLQSVSWECCYTSLCCHTPAYLLGLEMGKKDELVDVGDTASCGEVPTVNFSSTTINFT
jgi:hypothetical protein